MVDLIAALFMLGYAGKCINYVWWFLKCYDMPEHVFSVCSSSSRHPSVTNDNGLASPFDKGVFLLKEMRLDKNNTKVKEK